jgi:hypothetical protein
MVMWVELVAAAASFSQEEQKEEEEENMCLFCLHSFGRNGKKWYLVYN